MEIKFEGIVDVSPLAAGPRDIEKIIRNSMASCLHGKGVQSLKVECVKPEDQKMMEEIYEMLDKKKETPSSTKKED